MKSQIESIFSEIEETIFQTLRKIKAPEGLVYACSFWLFYCDSTLLGVPCFAFNIEGKEVEAKWSPPEWIVDIEDSMVEALTPAYGKVTELMENESEENWDELIEFQWGFYCKLCRKINKLVKTENNPLSHWNLSEDFVMGIFEEREEEDLYEILVKESVGEETAVKLKIIDS